MLLLETPSPFSASTSSTSFSTTLLLPSLLTPLYAANTSRLTTHQITATTIMQQPPLPLLLLLRKEQLTIATLTMRIMVFPR
jgi:hypothetical protein